MKTESMRNGLSVKQNLLGVLLIIGVAFIAYVWVSQPAAEAKENYIAQSPALQAELDRFELDVVGKRCQLHKKLAAAKLLDDMNGIKFDLIDRNLLAEKRDADCSF